MRHCNTTDREIVPQNPGAKWSTSLQIPPPNQVDAKNTNASLNPLFSSSSHLDCSLKSFRGAQALSSPSLHRRPHCPQKMPPTEPCAASCALLPQRAAAHNNWPPVSHAQYKVKGVLEPLSSSQSSFLATPSPSLVDAERVPIRPSQRDPTRYSLTFARSRPRLSLKIPVLPTLADFRLLDIFARKKGLVSSSSPSSFSSFSTTSMDCSSPPSTAD